MGTIGERFHALARDAQDVLNIVEAEPLLVTELIQSPKFKSLKVIVKDAIKRGYD